MDLDALDALIDRQEGERLTPYDDATGDELVPGYTLKGNVTISGGVNLSAGISPKESQMLRESRETDVLDDLETFPWWPMLSDTRQQAIASLRYNVGANGFRLFRKLIHALAVSDWDTAAQEIRNSQVAPARRAELAQMMEQG